MVRSDPEAKWHVRCGATSKGYGHRRDEDEAVPAAVGAASHRRSALTGGAKPARVFLSRFP